MADLASLTADQLAETVLLLDEGVRHPTADEARAALAELQTRANQRDEALREVEALGQRMYEETVPKNEANERIAHEQEQMRKLCADQRAEDLARAETAEKERDEAQDSWRLAAAGLVQAEQERDICRTHLADLQAGFRTHSDALAAAEARLAELSAEDKP